MKTEYKIIFLSVFFFAVICVIDAGMTYLFFHSGSFWDSLILDVPARAVYHRSLVTASFLIFGFIAARAFTKQKRAEEAIVRAKNEWERTFDAVPDLVAIIDHKQGIVRLNKTMAEKLRLTQEEAVGKTCYEVVHGAQTHPSFCPHAQMMMDGKEHTAEFLEKRLGGTFLVSVSPIRDAQGTLTGCVHVARDVTDRIEAREELQLEKHKFQTLAEQSPLGMAMIGQDGTFQYINPPFKELFGYDLDEIPNGKKWLRLAYPDRDYRHEVIAAWLSDMNTSGIGGKRSRVFTVNCKDGSKKIIHFMTVQLPDGNHLMTCEDITERKYAEEQLQESEKRYRTLFESAGDCIYIMDADGQSRGQIVSANRSAVEMHGYPMDEILSLNIADLDTPESAANIPARMERILKGETVREVVTHRRKDGTVFPLEINARLLELGNHKYVLAIDRDITDRTAAENALRASEERMRRLIEVSPVGIRVARQGKYIYANPAFARIFGYEDPDEIVGLPVVSLYVPEERERIGKLAEDRASGKVVPSDYEVRGLRKDGEKLDIAVWLTTMDYEGEPATLGFTVDISKEKSLRAQLLQAQKMESLGTLAGGIAHDFNNLLTIIVGFSDILLLRKAKDDPDYANLRSIAQAAQNAADLVRRILTFSRRVETKLRPLNLNHELTQAEKLLRRTIPRMVEIELRLDDNLKTVNADPGQMEQIILNLAVNAKDAMPEGGRLTIETKNVALDELYCRKHLGTEPGNYVLLTVSDTGQGMTGGVVDRIFEPFFTTKQPGEGTGLGLAMVFGIVEGHGGYVTCESAPNLGTTFKIYLPAMEMEETLDVATSGEMPAFGTETILLVDDEESVMELGDQMLTLAGYTVLKARNGKEALEIYLEKRDDISLVILDLIMPVMGGSQCMEEILKVHPKAKILLASGYAADEPTKQVIEAHAKGFVVKPFKAKEILRTIRQVLDAD